MLSIGAALKTVGLFVVASVIADIIAGTGVTRMVADLLVAGGEFLIRLIQAALDSGAI